MVEVKSQQNLIKNPEAKERGNIFYCDIGDDLKQQEKLQKTNEFKSISAISKSNLWQKIMPDKHGDWINQRDETFDQHIKLGDKKNKNEVTVFENYSLGINSNRDNWAYNFSKKELNKNMQATISFYNSELKSFTRELVNNSKVDSDEFVNNDESKVKWSSSLRSDFKRKKEANFYKDKIVISTYRPFIKEWLYFDGMFNHRVGQIPKIFPIPSLKNKVIHVAGSVARSGFSALMTDNIPDIQNQDNGQCFPLKLFEYKESKSNSESKPIEVTEDLFGDIKSKASDLFKENSEGDFIVRDGITDAGLEHFQKAYAGEKIGKEDIFYYIYGILHSEDYKTRFADNLSKELPRIPLLKKADDFWKFSKAGRDLAELHLNYETIEPYAVNFEGGNLAIKMLKKEDFRVEKMKFAKNGKEIDKTKIIYNHKITFDDIPLEAYDYIVNGKPALEWVMERQSVSTHKASGIVNDANDWANETMKNPRYPLDLFLRVITVSLRTMKIVNSLPKLDI